MLKGSGRAIHQLVRGNIRFQLMLHLQQLTGKLLSAIPANDLLMQRVFSAGVITVIMAQECLAIFLYTFFQAFILSRIHLVLIKYMLPEDYDTGKMGVKFLMFC